MATRVGFTGGHTQNPTYRQVCTKTTGHAEAVEVTYDADLTSFKDLAKLFFEMHDPTIDRSSKGGQYRSAIFYQDQHQKEITEGLIALLKDNGFDIKTSLEPASVFWQAEARHQKYCESRGFEPKSHKKLRFAEIERE